MIQKNKHIKVSNLQKTANQEKVLIDTKSFKNKIELSNK
jgi:hypothetical protein